MTGVAQTSVAVQIAGVIDKLRRLRFSGAVVGPAGIGKTCVANMLASTTSYAHMVTATEALGKKPNLLWQGISWALGYASEKSAADTQLVLFAESFADHVLLVDEAHQLPPVHLREILTLSDRCGLSVCFLGNMGVLHRSHSRQAAWDQIETRLAIVHKLEGFADGDAAALAGMHGIRDPEALALLNEIGERHHARGIVNVIEAARVAVGMRATIDAAAIRKTLQIFPKYRVAPDRKAARRVA